MVRSIIEQKKRQRNLLIILVVILISTGIVLYWGLLYEGDSTGHTVVQGEVKKKEINIDLDILDNSVLGSLKEFTEIQALNPDEEVGRENPFVPF